MVASRTTYRSSPRQLANLALSPRFRPGESGNHNGASTRPKNLERAIRRVRDLAPAAIEYLGKVLRDENAPMHFRLRAAEVILDKALGRGDKATQMLMRAEQEGPSSLRVVFVKPWVNYDEPMTPTIEAGSTELAWSDAGIDEQS
jgi:hypothetical protein